MTAHETIFNAINGVYREPKLSFDCANAVVEALAAEGFTIMRPITAAEEAANQW